MKKVNVAEALILCCLTGLNSGHKAREVLMTKMDTTDRHIPVRMCVICRTRAPKSSLLRHVEAQGRAPVPDSGQTAPGRGMYICGQSRCREAFSRRCAKSIAKGQDNE